jgi:hypothetical protein
LSARNATGAAGQKRKSLREAGLGERYFKSYGFKAMKRPRERAFGERLSKHVAN